MADSLPAECAAEQTDELNGCCSAGRGWSKTPAIQPERGLHPKMMPSAELVPEKKSRRRDRASSYSAPKLLIRQAHNQHVLHL